MIFLSHRAILARHFRHLNSPPQEAACERRCFPKSRDERKRTKSATTKLAHLLPDIPPRIIKGSCPRRCENCHVVILSFLFFGSLLPLRGGDTAETMPLSQIQPGMKGVAYTIFEGDRIEKIDLVVLGTLHNALGPKQDVILVQLIGEKVEHTGVVAGMSGSPVYFDGKLAGALSLKLGVFTKEAIGGVTPIENMLDVEKAAAFPATPIPGATPTKPASIAEERIPLPESYARQFSVPTSAGSGQFLVPIETPLVSTGLYPETIAQFGKQLSAWGMTMMAGGTAAPSPEDAQIKPGDMVGMELIRGDLSIAPGCTVTTVVGDQVLACGHPIFGFGAVALPLTRGHVILTLASSMASTKIMSTGGLIGTLTQDRLTAVMGKLGAGPPMIPLDVHLVTPSGEKNFHFEVIESPQLTPLLVALATFNGIVASPAYGEGSTLAMDGSIDDQGAFPGATRRSLRARRRPRTDGIFCRHLRAERIRADLFKSLRTSARGANSDSRHDDARAPHRDD